MVKYRINCRNRASNCTDDEDTILLDNYHIAFEMFCDLMNDWYDIDLISTNENGTEEGEFIAYKYTPDEFRKKIVPDPSFAIFYDNENPESGIRSTWFNDLTDAHEFFLNHYTEWRYLTVKDIVKDKILAMKR